MNIFADMKEAMRDALARERGAVVNLRVTQVPSPPKPVSPREIRRIRKMLNASQTVFASYLTSAPTLVSFKAVKTFKQKRAVHFRAKKR